jgi:hypothetical protein
LAKAAAAVPVVEKMSERVPIPPPTAKGKHLCVRPPPLPQGPPGSPIPRVGLAESRGRREQAHLAGVGAIGQVGAAMRLAQKHAMGATPPVVGDFQCTVRDVARFVVVTMTSCPYERCAARRTPPDPGVYRECVRTNLE